KSGELWGRTSDSARASGSGLYAGMVRIPETEFLMGSDNHHPEERPARRAHVDGFWIDRAPVTNARFRAFVEATSYVTFAELAPEAELYAGANPDFLHAGSLVFVAPPHPVSMGTPINWAFIRGAN